MQYPVRTGPIQNDQARFSPEMVQGYHPDMPIRLMPLREGMSVSQLTHTPAPFSMEMAQGHHPDAPNRWLPLRTGWMSSQTTHVPAPFSIDMVTGSIPAFNRALLHQQAYPVLPPDVSSFTIESVFGSRPEARRAPVTQQAGPVLPPDVQSITIESIFASRPDAPRLYQNRTGFMPQVIDVPVIPPPPAHRPVLTGFSTFDGKYISLPTAMPKLAALMLTSRRLTTSVACAGRFTAFVTIALKLSQGGSF